MINQVELWFSASFHISKIALAGESNSSMKQKIQEIGKEHHLVQVSWKNPISGQYNKNAVTFFNKCRKAAIVRLLRGNKSSRMSAWYVADINIQIYYREIYKPVELVKSET